MHNRLAFLAAHADDPLTIKPVLQPGWRLVCPPSTVFAAYNEITAGKDISVHPFSGHTVPASQVERQLKHLRKFFPG